MISYLKKIKFLQMVYRRTREMSIYSRFIANKSSIPDKRFVLFAQGRTGSDLLCSLINSHQEIFCDEEILNQNVLFPLAFVKGNCVRSKKDVYGFKLKIYHLTGAQQIDNVKEFLWQLYDQGWKIIYLFRRNIFRQVISGFVARERKSYHYRVGDKPLNLEKIYIDCDELFREMRGRLTLLEKEKEVLKNLPHLTVNYEDHLLSAEMHQKTLDRIFSYLDVSSVSVKTDLLKITPDRLYDLIKNYKEVTQIIKNTEYSEFLLAK